MMASACACVTRAAKERAAYRSDGARLVRIDLSIFDSVSGCGAVSILWRVVAKYFDSGAENFYRVLALASPHLLVHVNLVALLVRVGQRLCARADVVASLSCAWSHEQHDNGRDCYRARVPMWRKWLAPRRGPASP